MKVQAKILFPESVNTELLAHQTATKQDLLNLANLLLSEYKNINKSEPTAQWLKSAEVRKILKISPGTLQNLRINGTLQYKKIGGLLYYKYEDLTKMLEK